jgi:hypothetical protein
MAIRPITDRDKDRIKQLKAMSVNEFFDELEVMHQMLCMWSRDYGDEGDPRLALITSMVADLVTILRHGLADVVRE